MSLKKCKLILKAVKGTGNFRLVKSVNTLEFGTPGDILNRRDVDLIMKTHEVRLSRKDLTIEFID